jgi:hypothetical protein
MAERTLLPKKLVQKKTFGQKNHFLEQNKKKNLHLTIMHVINALKSIFKNPTLLITIRVSTSKKQCENGMCKYKQ